MCGIVVGLAFSKLNQTDESMRQRLLRYFTTELMIATEERGKDATGAVVLFNDGKYMGLKRGETVTGFLSSFGETKEYYGSLLKVWREHDHRGRVYLGHCRAGTSGDKEDNENNHPIKINNLIGVHNGVIKNHDVIFKNLGCKRDGKVDSESIFRLFDHYTKNGKEPFTLDMIQEIVNKLDGHFAVTMFNADNLEQIPVFRDGRPVEFILIRKYGILLAVSEAKFWNRVYFRYERMVHYYNEIHRHKLPSFLDADSIVTKTMPDDTAVIFDMSNKVTSETEVADLCESRKMIRVNKIWQSSVTGTHTNYHNSYPGTSYNQVHTSKSIDDNKKSRVFDNITKQFKVKIGDKIVDSSKSATLPVDKEAEKDDKSTSTDLITKATTPDSRKEVFKEDTEDEKKSDNKASLKDHTIYDSKENESENKIIDVDPKDIKEIEPNGNLTEIQMTAYSPEIVESANKAYEDLPNEQKGCGDMEELLDAIDIETEERAESLGPALLGNRAIKHGWLQGYMHAIHTLSVPSDNKSRLREHHIAGLKSLVVLLAGFYEKSSNPGNRNPVGKSSLNTWTKHRLAQVALDSDKTVDIDGLMKIFNSHEKQLVEKVGNIISQASDIIKDD